MNTRETSSNNHIPHFDTFSNFMHSRFNQTNVPVLQDNTDMNTRENSNKDRNFNSLQTRLIDALTPYNESMLKNFEKYTLRNQLATSSNNNLGLIDNTLNEKITYELISIGLFNKDDIREDSNKDDIREDSNKDDVSRNTISCETPQGFKDFLSSLIGQNIHTFKPNLKQVIIDASIYYVCPYSCIDSHLERNKKNYIKFVCKFHTTKRTNCSSNFKILIRNDVVYDIEFDQKLHNHFLDELFISSRISLITSHTKDTITEASKNGLPTCYIRRFICPKLLPDQLYNATRKGKKEYFDDEIGKLHEYLTSVQNNYCTIWQFDSNNKFYDLLIINSRIKKCAYAKDIIVMDDTMCTNRFQYPILPFIVFDENNAVQILAIAIIKEKDEIYFANILRSFKSEINSVKIFLIDRLISQTNAIKKIFPSSKIVYCRLHIKRNIEHHMGRNSKILEAFMLFIHEKINREDCINMLKENIKNSNKFKKHIQKLIDN